jgi:hypothetical protein
MSRIKHCYMQPCRRGGYRYQVWFFVNILALQVSGASARFIWSLGIAEWWEKLMTGIYIAGRLMVSICKLQQALRDATSADEIRLSCMYFCHGSGPRPRARRGNRLEVSFPTCGSMPKTTLSNCTATHSDDSHRDTETSQYHSLTHLGKLHSINPSFPGAINKFLCILYIVV